MTGVIILHAVVLTGVIFTGGCNSTPVLGPRPFIPAPVAHDGTVVEDKTKAPVPDDSIPPITINQTVTTPATPTPPPFKIDNAPKNITYTVQKNDSFWKVARKHGVTMQSLAAYNKMSLNKPLMVGQKLMIPPGGYVVENLEPVKTRKTVKSTKAAKSVGKVESRPSDGIYIVKSGDSFWKIARKHNLKTKTLLAANNMTGKETLRIGQKLVIPENVKSASTASVVTPAADKAITKDTSVTSILDSVGSPDETVKPAAKDASKAQAAPVIAAKPAEVDKIDDTGDSDRAVQVVKDIKVEDFAKQYKVTPEMLKKLNDDYPADGVFKAGSYVIVRPME